MNTDHTVPVPRNATLKTCGGPLVQAHRGSRGEYQDNAAGGFRWCIEKGIRGFETDVRFSKDRQLVIMHDPHVGRTSDGDGIVEEHTLAELKAMRLQSCSEPIPSLADVFDALGGRDDIFVELEMKAAPDKFYTPETLEAYCRALSAAAKSSLVPGTYAFTSFHVETLAMMRRVDPQAPLGYITGPLTQESVDTALSLGCCSIAATGHDSTKDMVAKAHAAGLTVCLWMCQSKADWDEYAAKGADRVTSDFPHLLTLALQGRRKKVVALDLDGTLCQHRSPIPERNRAALKALCERYKCVMIGAGNPPRIYRQMENFPIDIVGNYGMQTAEAADGQFRIVESLTSPVDKEFFRRETDALRRKYGYTEYSGEPLEFHASGMVTFGLLGTTPSTESKLAFDPDRRKRRAMYADVCRIFKDYTVYIGGSSSFDIAGRRFNKFDTTLSWAEKHGFVLDDIVFIGDDFADGGGDSHVRLRGMDHIVVARYEDFAADVGVLLS